MFVEVTAEVVAEITMEIAAKLTAELTTEITGGLGYYLQIQLIMPVVQAQQGLEETSQYLSGTELAQTELVQIKLVRAKLNLNYSNSNP